MSGIERLDRVLFDPSRSELRGSGTHPRARLTRKQIGDVSLILDSLIVCLGFEAAEFFYPILVGTNLKIGASYTLVGVVAGLLHFLVARTRQGTPPQLP